MQLIDALTQQVLAHIARIHALLKLVDARKNETDKEFGHGAHPQSPIMKARARLWPWPTPRMAVGPRHRIARTGLKRAR